jgi:TetR/AcrR family fatty acid metabolism transcriptional regulator
LDSKTQTKNRKILKNPGKASTILNAAEHVFAEKGFHEATLSDIAKKANVSEATIYEYFLSKEELLFSIPKEETLQYLKKSEELLQYIPGAANKLRMLIYQHLKLYNMNPDYAKVVMLILKTNRKFLQTETYKIVQASSRFAIQVLEEGIKNGEFRPDIQPYLVRAMIYGAIEHLATRKSLLGVPEDLLSLADDIIKNIFQGILVPSKRRELTVHVTLEHKKLRKLS